MRYEKEIMPVLRCNLRAGDWLYIPAGYWHRTLAVSESISLSVGIAARSGIDVLDFIRGQLLDSLRWRQRILPIVESGTTRDDATALAAHLAELAQDLAAFLTAPSTAAAFTEFCRATSTGLTLTNESDAHVT
jgi:50S ribosomal protein L16 3-hydroxylase